MMAFWLMIAVVVAAALAFISVLAWLDGRRKEREAHYRNEMARRIAEASDPAPVLEYIGRIEQAEAAQTRTKARVSGLITLATGAALMIFLHQIAPGTAVYLVGLIPLLVGVVLLVSSELFMRTRK
ncbi:hypothetical protein CSC70_11280 [Pseudoxanthomonas kalamensis DSM 18571]|uniref:hypothetical protein n=1 Tax=Pseudoxanthomonas kalamensis TaxID=289483 RepID=UPI001391E9AC|nr:hypothetical protein [Pseudoxanthomonas kalamensis]KAF1709380.1 hypothetical protein CSC70_11280 [Pseudoxanthomonas kalamensis DSM 18571]